MNEFGISSSKRIEMIDITARVQEIVSNSKIKDGIIFLFVPHTTAGITINENADASVQKDIINKLNQIVPENDDYLHQEGNSDSHIKASLFSNENFIFIENGRLKLGTWQGIYFCEFDGPRKRKVFYKII
jgi:secondary thiamine-phosphate synthase enzyme